MGTWSATSGTGEAKIIGIGREVTRLRKDGTDLSRTFSVGRIAEPRSAPLRRPAARRTAEHEASAPSNWSVTAPRVPGTQRRHSCSTLDSGSAIVEINAHGSDNLLVRIHRGLRGREWLHFYMAPKPNVNRRGSMFTARWTSTGRESTNVLCRRHRRRRRIYWRCIALLTPTAPARWLVARRTDANMARRASNTRTLPRRG